jgi:hypothetical protein
VTPGSYPLHPALPLLTTGSLAVFAPQDADAVGALRHVPCRFDTLDVPQYPQLRHRGGHIGPRKALKCVLRESAPQAYDGHSHTLRAKERPWRSVPTAAVDVPEGWAPGLCRSAACRRRRRFFEGASVDGGRLALEQSWCSRVSSASRRLRRASPTSRTHRGVCGQAAAAMSSPAGRGARIKAITHVAVSSCLVSTSLAQIGSGVS